MGEEIGVKRSPLFAAEFPLEHIQKGDPSLRLKSGSAQDDAIAALLNS